MKSLCLIPRLNLTQLILILTFNYRLPCLRSRLCCLAQCRQIQNHFSCRTKPIWYQPPPPFPSTAASCLRGTHVLFVLIPPFPDSHIPRHRRFYRQANL